MAIKIIQQGCGKKPIYQGRCYHCECSFEFEHSDANAHIDDQIQGFSYNVTCPCCKRKVWVDRKILRYDPYITNKEE